jgi:hypothetical protein
VNSPQGFRAVLRVPQGPPVAEVTIDDRDDGFYCTPQFWVGHRFCRAERKGFGGRYLTNGGRAADGEFARFTPDLQAGRYEVFFSEETPFAPDAAFRVRVCHGRGEETVRVEPSRSLRVGTFDFEEGADGFVEIHAGGSMGLVVADAVTFRRIGA